MKKRARCLLCVVLAALLLTFAVTPMILADENTSDVVQEAPESSGSSSDQGPSKEDSNHAEKKDTEKEPPSPPPAPKEPEGGDTDDEPSPPPQKEPEKTDNSEEAKPEKPDVPAATEPDEGSGEPELLPTDGEDPVALAGDEDASLSLDIEPEFAPLTVQFDPQPLSMQEVQSYIDRFESELLTGGLMAALALKPHWEFAVSAELMPAGYVCDLVDWDEDFGANYYTFFASVMPMSTVVSDFATLQTAITSATGSPEIITIGSDIEFTGTITITGTKNIKFEAEDGAVSFQPAGGMGDTYLFTIATGVAVTLSFDGVSIDGKDSKAALNNSGMLTLNGANIHNSRNNAGAIYNQGSLTIHNSTMRDCINPANGPVGGAIRNGVNSSSLTVTDSNFYDNVAGTAGDTTDGGAIGSDPSSQCTLTLTNCTFSGNSARYGGAVRNNNAATIITGCTFSENNATGGQGAGLYVASSPTTVTNSDFIDNIRNAILVNACTLNANNCTVSGTKSYGVYGISEVSAEAVINATGCTITGNTCTSYGAGMMGWTSGAGKVTINVIGGTISGNTASGDGSGRGAGIASYGNTNVYINVSGGAKIINNNAKIAGGGIWIWELSRLTTDGVTFSGNRAETGYLWSLDDADYAADAAIHQSNIKNTTYTRPFTNAYSNYDVNYAAGTPIDPTATYTVTYDANGGTGSHQDSVSILDDYEVLALAGTGIARSGATFAGWNTKADGSGTAYAAGDDLALSGNITLYARWSISNFTVTYNANGGSGGSTGSHPAGNYTVLSASAAGVSRTGYTFIGWNTEANGSGTPYSPQATLNLSGNVTLYAQWTITNYTVIYNANGGSGGSTGSHPAGNYTVLSASNAQVSRTGYTFTGWNTHANGSGTPYAPGDKFVLSSNMTFYARWTSNATPTPRPTATPTPNTGTTTATPTPEPESTPTPEPSATPVPERTVPPHIDAPDNVDDLFNEADLPEELFDIWLELTFGPEATPRPTPRPVPPLPDGFSEEQIEDMEVPLVGAGFNRNQGVCYN